MFCIRCILQFYAFFNSDESEIPSIYMYYGVHHMFKAYMSEEEADKVAGKVCSLAYGLLLPRPPG